MTDTRPKPTKQQRKLFLGLIDRQLKLMDEESEYFWKERPWLMNPNHPKPWGTGENPVWEEEKRVLKKKILKVCDEIDKLFKEMYPPSIYPELHGASEQPSLIEGVPAQLHNVPKDPPKVVENMTMEELHQVFDPRKKNPSEEVQAKTSAGAEILARFQAQVNRRKGY